MLNLVLCGGFSPGARILRKAVRRIADAREVNVVTLAPALAGLEGRGEEIRSLEGRTVILDGCEGGCGIQGMVSIGAHFDEQLILPKYPIVNDVNVADAEERIISFLEGCG